MKQVAEQVVGRFPLPVAQHRLGQAHALRDRHQMAAGTLGAVMQRDHVDLLRVDVMALLQEPLPDSLARRVVGAGDVAEVGADIRYACSIDVACGHGVHLAVRKRQG